MRASGIPVRRPVRHAPDAELGPGGVTPDPGHRLRRTRRTEALRSLVREAERHAALSAAKSDKPPPSVPYPFRTAAEMLVFARYVMFSEVYWHHAVRAAAVGADRRCRFAGAAGWRT